ncbi:MAG: nicotinate phosphoribosyltransferase [Deltaproteobacteria bacterium]|nr:nicotinate phosphoribosyltransferase [Deltaproteobacteria bacterium]
MSIPPPLVSALGIWTDLYQLTMAAAYHVNHMADTATFELFVRTLPRQRGFLLVAGLEEALGYLEAARFAPEDLDYLRSLPQFRGVPEDFFAYLARFRFTGDVRAVSEGTPVFAGEPILQITAPLPEAQLVETYLLSVVNFATLVGTKAARMVEAAAGRAVVDFGFRRAHGPHAAVSAARAAFLGGCVGTSNVEAGRRWGIPVFGTASHAFVMACPSETEAFQRYHRAFPTEMLLLIDTYDTLQGVKKAIALGDPLKGVRLDSGDLLALSREVRRMLDDAGYRDTRIVASGDLDEHRIAELLAQGAPIDVFGVGTSLVTSHDAPSLEGVYKLVELGEGEQALGRIKTSAGKETLPGRKQVFRAFDAAGRPQGDRIARIGELPRPGEQPLLQPVMRGGRRVGEPVAIERLRGQAGENVRRLPAGVRALSDPAPYPVAVSEALRRLTDDLRRTIREEEARSK